LVHLRVLLTVIALLIHQVAANAEDNTAREAALFEPPVTVQRVAAKSTTDPISEIKCSYYPDFMIRETGTDSPNPGGATIVPPSGASQHQVCSRAPVAHGVPLKTEFHSLVGRKGPYLVFSETDPSGSVGFVVINAGTGRVIYKDGKTPVAGLQSVALENGVLHLRYTRSINGSCSIVKDGSACWAKMVRERAIPHEVAKSPPSIQACATEYRKGKVPAAANDPSIVFYEVDMMLDVSGHVRVNSHGAVGCEPMA
jgi:hypothetical protein